MASIAAACRTSARAASQQLRNYGARRAFHAGQASLAAQNFNMPALSPTMTEGNIASWKIKEGDSFAAGDVLLEIETDKAQMDVEAQEDGILAKIIVGDGSKAIQVGARIAVTAEPGDDVSSLEMPAENSPAPEETKSAKEQPKQEPRQESKSVPQEERTSSPPAKADATNKVSSAKTSKQAYPLYPSVQHLLGANGLSKEDADKIPATGPNGRLLKGDVLAYIGEISDSYPSELADRFKVLSHLDLSNIKVAAKKEAPKKAAEAAKAPAAANVIIDVKVSLANMLAWQNRLKETPPPPLHHFVDLATRIANENLPRSKLERPSANELFNYVLGVDKAAAKKYTQGNLDPVGVPYIFWDTGAKKPDILDILAGKSTARTRASRPKQGQSVPDANRGLLFSVSVPAGDEKRGQVFLERIKAVLEKPRLSAMDLGP